MRRIAWVLIACLAFAGSASAQWYENGEIVEDTAWRKSGESVSAMLMLTLEPEAFFAQWNRPAEPGYRPEVEGADSVKRGDMIVALVLFTGCKPDEAGQCRAVSSYEILAPDGSEYARIDDAPLWDGKPLPPEDYLQVAEAYVGVIIEPQDALGTYTINARVCDRVVGECLTLTRSFEATHRLEAFEPDAFLSYYYLDPRPEWVPQAIRDLGASGALDNRGAAAAVIGFYAQLFAGHPDELQAWQAVVAEQPETAREVFAQATALAQDVRKLKANERPSPQMNDLLWGAYFASGDTGYLDPLIRNTRLAAERQDLELFLAGASAKWSLAANVRQHARVGQYVEQAVSVADESLAASLRDVLELEPTVFREELERVIREQRAAGVW